MPRIEKVGGGRLYLMSHEQMVTVGDEIEVGEEKAAQLCDGRGTFQRVDDAGDGTDTSTGTTAGNPFADVPPVHRDTLQDPSDATVAELRTALDSVDDPAVLDTVKEAEEEGDNRTTAFDAIDDRRDELEG